MSYAAAVSQYQSASTFGGVIEATPHKLIELLYGGLIDRLAQARGAIGNGETQTKLRAVSSALSIVDHLRLSLDKKAGGAIASNLEMLYDYMARRLIEANASNNAAMIDEVLQLTRELKSGWDAVATS
ncbi:flagellar export chaperone FliS [Sinimarinibacterium sp. CAU 1509]|uniref:flagellar export chaperone FliS n=1 Tax=Sinimarinibacterium sp. CAU 1509 TaxID=2562283 RepID=UPI00200B71D1|nr:flagellar export chaperone FliS [Sinimarinibacterium sp. CAU 1509]